MKIRRRYHNHDTNIQPEIGIWIEQSPIPAVDSSGWIQLGPTATILDESLVFTAAVDGTTVKRSIPGIVNNHLYKITVTVDSIDAGAIDISLGGALAGSVSAVGTHTLTVRPPGDYAGAGHSVTLLLIAINNPGSVITTEISRIIVKAMDPINFDLIPVLWTP